MAGFIFKGISSGGLNPGGTSVILGNSGARSVQIIGPNGQVVDSLLKSNNIEGGNVKFYSKRPGATYGSNFITRVTDASGATYDYNIGSGGGHYEGEYGNPGSLQATAYHSDIAGGGFGMFNPMGVGGGYAFAPAYLGGQYPSPVYGDYKNIKPADFKFTDPLEFAGKIGEFNRGESRKNLDFSKELALDELTTELEGLKGYAPAAAALSREQTSLDNVFNQAQKSAQVDTALPGVRGDLEGQRSRALSYAEGRTPDSISDRALELGIRSNAADSSGGFGVGSSASRKISDLMSAEKRIALSQYGDSLLSNNINQKANLFLAPTEYANTGSQIKVNPTVSASQLQAQAFSELNANTTLSPSAALTATIQQEQFKTNLIQGTREFNAGNRLQNSQFNAQIGNQFSLGQFGYNVGYAGALAGAYQTDANTQLALQQQSQYADIFRDQMGAAQGANQAGAVAQGGAVLATQLPQIIKGVGSIIDSITGGSSGAAQSGGSYVDSQGGFGIDPVATSPTYTNSGGSTDYGSVSIPDTPSLIPDGGFLNTGSSAPSYSLGGGDFVSGGSGGGGGGGPVETFVSDMGVAPLVGKIGDPNRAVTRSLLTQSGAVMNTAGVYGAPTPDSIPIGVTNNGSQLYASVPLLKNNNSSEGTGFVASLSSILNPLGVLTNEDAGALDKIGGVAGSSALLATLTAQYQQGDKKGMVNTMLTALEKPTIEAVTKDPQNQAGLAGAFTAYNLAQNWGQMSPAQRSLGIASLGIQGYKFGTGENLAEKKIIPPSEGNPGLSVGQGLALFQAGYNTYSLAKNWNQLNPLQKIAAGSGDAAQIANLAKSFGMLGSGTSGAEVGTATAQSLASAGWAPSPSLGIGAITSNSASQVPAGYQVVSNAGNTVVATPAGTAQSAATAQAGTVLGTVAGVSGVALGAKTVYDNWGEGGKKGALNGAIGGSAMAAGLYALGASNPYLLGGMIAYSALGGRLEPDSAGGKTLEASQLLNPMVIANPEVLLVKGNPVSEAFKTNKSGDQSNRDSVRSYFKKSGLTGNDYNITLADGSKFNIGIDGHGGQRPVSDPSKLTREQANTRKLNAWDIDYTNDLDYTAGLAGTALSRILTGSKNTSVDQLGGQVGNALLGNVGFGKEMNAQNFTKVQSNMKAVFSQMGIKSKADAYALANKGFADDRWNEADTVAMHQVFNIAFDKDGFTTAQKLMGGRFRGIEVAQSTPPVKTPDTSQRRNLVPLKSAVPSSTKRFGLPKDEIKRLNSLKYRGSSTAVGATL